MARDAWMSREDRNFLRDMAKEQEQEMVRKDDPARKHLMCKCGHRLAQHYMGNRAMPCGKCSCSSCTAPAAEEIRRQKARLGVQDISPHPEFEQVRRKG